MPVSLSGDFVDLKTPKPDSITSDDMICTSSSDFRSLHSSFRYSVMSCPIFCILSVTPSAFIRSESILSLRHLASPRLSPLFLHSVSTYFTHSIMAYNSDTKVLFSLTKEKAVFCPSFNSSYMQSMRWAHSTHAKQFMNLAIALCFGGSSTAFSVKCSDSLLLSIVFVKDLKLSSSAKCFFKNVPKVWEISLWNATPAAVHALRKLWALSITEYSVGWPIWRLVFMICDVTLLLSHDGLTAISTIATSARVSGLPTQSADTAIWTYNFCLPTDKLSSWRLTYDCSLYSFFALTYMSRPIFSHQSSIVWWLGILSNSLLPNASFKSSRIFTMEREPHSFSRALSPEAILTTNSLNL